MADWIGVDVADSTCSMPDCANPVFVKMRGWCKRHYVRWQATGSPDIPTNLVCAWCGCNFVRPANDGPVPRFCSKRCRVRSKPKPPRPVRTIECDYCGDVVVAKVPHKRFCRPACRDAFYEFGEPMLKRNCHICGDELDFSARRPGGQRLSRVTRKCFSCRRDQNYPVTVEQLAARDGAVCALCREPVDMTLQWPDHGAPTRDHITPVSRGGDNSESNFQLAHFLCNVRKKNRVS